MGRVEVGSLQQSTYKPETQPQAMVDTFGFNRIQQQIDEEKKLRERMQVRQRIQQQIGCAREGFLQERSNKAKGKLTYNPDHDRAVYQTLHAFRKDTTGAYNEELAALNGYTKFQVETFLGERYNTGLSRYKLEIENDEIRAEGVNESMLRMLQRGRDYRRLHGSSEHDQQRENAEVAGFVAIQEVLVDPETPIGTMMLSISPPGGEGSIYAHNFYDLFTVKEKEGKRYIEARRYSSALTPDEAQQRIKEYDERYATKDTPSDAYFLSHPVRLDPKITGLQHADDVHAFLHKEHAMMTEQEFQELLQMTLPVILKYIRILCETPWSEKAQLQGLNAILADADKNVNLLRNRSTKTEQIIFDQTTRTITDDDIKYLNTLPIALMNTGCGISGAYTMGGELRTPMGTASGAPYSVIDYGYLVDRYGDRRLPCPSCSFENLRPYNTLVPSCNACGSTEVFCA